MDEQRKIEVVINKKRYEITEPTQTGASLKNLAGIPLSDVLFLQRPHEDEVIPNETTIEVKNGDQFHSQPPANYGLGAPTPDVSGVPPERAALHPQPGGWHHLVIRDFQLPGGFQPNNVEVLIKLPPGFPDAAPDMFWVHPAVRTPAGSVPRGTSSECLLGKTWQRFSWHLGAGAWKPGASDLRDYLRCIHSRFLRND